MAPKRLAKGAAAQKPKRGASGKISKQQPPKKKPRTRPSQATSPFPPAPYLQPPASALNRVPTQILAVLVFGNGENGELGLGPGTTEVLRPRLNPFLDPDDPDKFHVVHLACGGMHTVALTADNKIITWGVNDNGALGRDTEWDEKLRDIGSDSGGDESEGELNPLESTPTEIPSHHFAASTTFVQVAAGDSCSFALTDEGLVYGWGTFRNASGDERFGYDRDGKPIERQTTPTLIPGIKDITQLTCGVNHVLALDAGGNIWGWGTNEQNQLGRRLVTRNQDSYSPTQVRVCRGGATYIASGDYHSFAVDAKDDVWGWGLNSYGEAGCDPKSAGTDSAVLPFPKKIPDLCGRGVVVLDGGAHHSAAVTKAGKCLAWGRMDGGQLGITFTPEELGDGKLIYRDARGKPAMCLRPVPVRDVAQRVSHVACGTDHTIFITRAGTAYATGFGSQGQLGLNSYDDVDAAQPLTKGKELKGWLVWRAAAGGQFSVVTGPAVLKR